MKSNPFRGKNAVVTGASSGIGWEIAYGLAKCGTRLFLIARDGVKLEKAADRIREKIPEINIKTFSADVSVPEQIQVVIREIGEKEGGIHILINNAGILGLGKTEKNSIEYLRKVMDINYFGAVYATQAAWPYLKKTGGHLGFVSSVAGFTGLFGYGAYAPTKFALTGLAECLRMEGKAEGIHVTIVFPPDTETPMLAYEREHTLPECLALSRRAKVIQPHVVAKKFLKALEKGRFEVLCNWESRLARWLRVFSPRLYFGIVDSIVKKA